MRFVEKLVPAASAWEIHTNMFLFYDLQFSEAQYQKKKITH